MALLIRGGTLVRCDAAGTVGTGDLLVLGSRIAALGAVGDAALAAARKKGPIRVIDARGCAVVPGFVQAHVHLCQVLFRGMADDLPLLEWLEKRIWPFEAAHDDASLAASAELGLLEMMLAGTTTILDMGTVHGYDVVFDACARSGIRVFGGKTMMDAGDRVPKGLRETTKASLKEADRLRDAWSGKADGRLRYAYAPRFILSCTEKLFRATAERAYAKGSDALLHSHVAEHPAERKAVKKVLGDEDIAMLRKWGFKGARTVLAHGVQLTNAEMDAVAADDTRITHCPSANLKLGSGIARVHEMKRRGIKVALGGDGAPCNNNLDPWIELRHAALLAKSRTGVTTLPAREAFELATIDGARALGIDAEVGSLEEGKRADVVVVRVDGPHVEPGGDAWSRLVYGCTSRDVTHVIADGDLVVNDRTHTRLDAERVLTRARSEAKNLVSRART
ncbi:MAG: amidohydrolase family protein [Labilithrix sp.]|nr:amidohydrolase family protein [Labilithrix sp.]MCW5810551.1 amidohydrolase family protein [Labilithrix sp.]